MICHQDTAFSLKKKIARTWRQSLRTIHHLSLSHMDPPMNAYVSDTFKANLPAAFLRSYVLDNHEDQNILKNFCSAYNKPVPITIVQKFTDQMYDLKTDPETNRQAAE